MDRPLPAPLPIPDYALISRIGQGSYGEVWLARNAVGSLVAIKIVRRSKFDHERPYLREFEGIQRFEPISRSDPSQVAILHVGHGGGFFYYVMELADPTDSPDVRSAQRHTDEWLTGYTPKTLKSVLRARGFL